MVNFELSLLACVVIASTNATKNLSINVNLGADVNSDDKIYSTSFGAAYKF